MTGTCATGNKSRMLVTRATGIIQTLSSIPNKFLAHINQNVKSTVYTMVMTTSGSHASPPSHKAIWMFFSPTKIQEKFKRKLLQHVWRYHHTFINRWSKPQKPLVIMQIHWSKLTLKTWMESRNANHYTTLRSSCIPYTARLFAWGSKLLRRQSQPLKSADRFYSLVSFPSTMDTRDDICKLIYQKPCHDILNQLPSTTITSPTK
jgi:hypothetical protein